MEKKYDTLYKIQQTSCYIINKKSNITDKDKIINKQLNNILHNTKQDLNSKLENVFFIVSQPLILFEDF